MQNVQRWAVTMRAAVLVGVTVWLAACAPEVGSERWCEAMREKPRGDWTANEALDFARNCVLTERD
jgi:hypothetical protein